MKTKLVQGVGINDVDYKVTKHETVIVNGEKKWKLVWTCVYYRTWADMLVRCYSKKSQKRYPSYRGCSVADEWLLFSNFKSWMEKQDWENNHLDKDILFVGNKVYSEDTCVFISPMVNTFVTDSGASRGQFLIGCYWNKALKKFQAYCNNPFTKNREHLGMFSSEQEAHDAWKVRKLELAKELAAMQSDPRVAKALIERYS